VSGGPITRVGTAVSRERVVAALLFTDIAGSTEIAERIGDKAWRELLGRHNREVRDQLDRYRAVRSSRRETAFLRYSTVPREPCALPSGFENERKPWASRCEPGFTLVG